MAAANSGQTSVRTTIRLTIEPVDLRELAERLVDQLEPVAQAKGLILECGHAETAVVSGDADWLKRLVLNLLDNALKFTPSGGRIHVTVGRSDHDVRIIVADNGVGIDPDVLPHVFEQFRQEDSSSTRAHGGLGLGLALVKHLIEQHGGQVKAESPGKGQGATFTVSIPLTRTR